MDKIELTQEQLDSQIAKAVEAAQGGVDKLKKKNSELLDELKAARKRVEEFADLDPAEVRAAVENAKAGERKALEQKGEYEKALELANKQHQDELKALQAKLDTATSSEKKLRVNMALEQAMDAAKVAPAFRKAVRAMHQGNVSIIEREGKPAAVVGDKSVADFMTEWATTDEGKFFVGDSGAGGGGAAGGKGGTSQPVNPWKKDTRNLTEQGRIEKSDPGLAKQLKQQAGVSV